MIYPKPLSNGYTIYTKSNCIYCIKAKKLLENMKIKDNKKIINCDDYLKNDKDDFMSFIEYLIGKKYLFMPIIFKNGKFIGGYNDLVLLLSL